MESGEQVVRLNARPSHPTLRILDANLNRAREALRVMEEFARFEMEDASLSGAIKEARHGLASSLVELGGRALPHAAENPPRVGIREVLARQRDILGDVGREIGTPSEYERLGGFDVAEAAAKRLTEALRVLEEYGKTLDRGFAAEMERLRYHAYELERRLILTTGARKRLGPVRLYVIVTESLCRSDWLATAAAALEGGADCLQLREKALTDRELFDRAKRAGALCREHGALFLVNDRPDIAAACGADGVHLGQDDMTVEAARRIGPSLGIVGLSTHTIEQAKRAAKSAVDYIAVGPMFETVTKPQQHIAGCETLAAVRARTGLPLVAIGGIDSGNAAAVLGSARCALCVCQAVIAQDDVLAATSHLRSVIDAAWAEDV